MPKLPIAENSGRILGVTLTGWAVAVAWAAVAGIFGRLDPGLDVALAAFATAFACATYALDGQVRGYLHRVARGRWLAAALVADVVIALAVAAACAAPEADPLAAFARLPFALVAYFGIPLAAVAHLAALAAPAGRGLRSSPARSPGAKPAAP